VDDVERKRVTVSFSVSDAPGALDNALHKFSEHGVNLSRIESKPSKRTCACWRGDLIQAYDWLCLELQPWSV
jgi:prephenate dehydratase